MYVITGATGHTGKAIAESLLAAGKPVRVIGRSADRLKPLADKGAEPFVGLLEDGSAMTRAFTGAKAVYAMIPPNPGAENFRTYQNRVGEALASGISAARVPFVVSLSSIGGHLPGKNGPIAGLHDQEERLNKLPETHIVHLRPGSFMENFLYNVGLIKHMGINGTPMKPDLPIPMIATRDIASAAVRLLLGLDFSGKSVMELLGQRDLSMAEATRILGTAIGKPDLPYVQFPYEEAEKAMHGMGFSQSVAGLFIEMYRGFNEGIIRPTENRSPKNTTPTAIEEFAKVFAVIYGQSA